MSLLEGGLQEVFGAAFGTILPSGTLHVPTITADGAGGYSRAFANQTVKGMVESYSERYRIMNAIPASDARLIVLQKGVAGPMTADCEITLASKRYKVIAWNQDPARAAWDIQGRPV